MEFRVEGVLEQANWLAAGARDSRPERVLRGNEYHPVITADLRGEGWS